MNDGIKVYIASSWKNADAVRALSKRLTDRGFEVYDFTDGDKHFAFNVMDVERFTGKDRSEVDWLDFNTCPETIRAFNVDRAGLDWADVVLMLLPCGRSAHMEAGYAAGRGKPLIIYGDLPAGEFETMYGFAYDCLRQSNDLEEDYTMLSAIMNVAHSDRTYGR